MENQAPGDKRGPKEEIRFAVVLNGGVSLAVWMGGAVREIDRVTRRQGVYRGLLDLLNVKARADVIAGTSAGGINGAALALSQANEKADVGLMRDLWAEQGRMESLLQRPFRGSPTSLLRGDDYFLPKLYQAMQGLTKGWVSTSAKDHPLELIITTTLLHGARTVTVDSLGQQLPQMLHQGHFAFRREDESTGGTRDDFHPEIAAALAIAARCTASFPVAFEPCFVTAKGRPDRPQPVNGLNITDLVDPNARPDLGEYVSWREAGPADAVPDDRSRYVVDGGVLANTPTKAALEAIERMPASGLVQRVMLLVYPHAPVNRLDPADRVDEPPTVAGAMGGLLSALLSQGNRTFVDEIEMHNRVSASRRGTRVDVMQGIGNSDDPESSSKDLERLAKCVFQQYRNQRVRRAASDLAARFDPPTDWSYERIRKAAETAHQAWMGGGRAASQASRSLPYVPSTFPTETTRPSRASWNWGATTALDLGDTALDLLQLLLGATTDPDDCIALASALAKTSKARADLCAIRDRVGAPWETDPVLDALPPDVHLWTLRVAHYARAMGNDSTRVAEAENKLKQHVTSSQDPSRQPDRQKQLADLDAALARLRATVPDEVPGQEAVSAVGEIVEAVLDALKPLQSVGDEVAQWAGLRYWKKLFNDLPTDPAQLKQPANRQKVLARLLWLHIVSWTFADDSGTGSSHPVDLVQISLQTQNPFAEQSTTLDDKVGGMSLNRFGGFLKRSWRMNDWTWGRMDAATMLCQIILSPERFRRRAVRNQQRNTTETAEGFVDKLIETLYVEIPAELTELRLRAIVELQAVYDVSRTDLPSSLPNLAAIAAWAVHMRVAVDELPSIADAVLADHNDRANDSSKGELFLQQYSSLIKELRGSSQNDCDNLTVLHCDPLTPAEVQLDITALRAFDRAGIGREPLEEEMRSDQMIRTATTAASVAVSVADSGRSGLGAIRPVTRALRGGMLVPYWTVLGLAAGGMIARFLALLALASGALLLAFSLLGAIGGGAAAPATAIGLGAILTAFGFAALRTGTLLHSIVLLTPVIPLAALAVYKATHGDIDRMHTVEVAVVILALALGLMVLGSLPAHLSSPLATLYRALDIWYAKLFPAQAALPEVSRWQKILRRLFAGVSWILWFAVRVAALTALVWLLVLAALWVIDQPAKWKADPTWVIVWSAAIVLAGWVVGYWVGWRLRSWAEVHSADGGMRYRTKNVSHAGGVAATWAVTYATFYAILAGVLVWRWPTGAGVVWKTALATAVAFALLLLYVVPLFALFNSFQVIARRLTTEARSGVIQWPNPVTSAAVVVLLCRHDLRLRCLLRSRDKGTWLQLTVLGWWLKRRVPKHLAADAS